MIFWDCEIFSNFFGFGDAFRSRYIWDLVLQHKQDRTILVSTHYMDEAEILCDQIAILHR